MLAQATMSRTFFCLLLIAAISARVAPEETCSERDAGAEPYGATALRFFGETIGMHNLPGFTRSVYERDHALIAPESRVYAPLVDWINTSAAHVVTPHMGAHFSMSLVTMGLEATADAPSSGVERFVFVLTGSLSVWPSEALQDTSTSTLQAGGFAYFPPSSDGSMATNTCQGATLIMYERRYVPLLGSQNRPQFQIGNTDDLALIPTVNEVFALRKLLPATDAYDFNVHIMDFEPGEYLNVKEMHYNQHGIMILEGQGIQRLGDKWYPVQAGDAVWMAPMVPQWYAALGTRRTRYILYKDTARDPLFFPHTT